jgi:hypothetical protein
MVVFSIKRDVQLVLCGKFFNGGFNGSISSFVSHSFGRKVGVASSSIPVSLERLGLEADSNSKVFGNSSEEISADPKMVTDINAKARTDLEFPLTRHHLSIGS